MPGALRHVESRELKAQRSVFRQVLTPRLPSLSLGAAVRSQTESTTTMKNSAVKALREPQDSFTALAVRPAWHQAIIQLANASERGAFRLEAFMGTPIDGATRGSWSRI